MESSTRILTIPNALSLARILLIPVFVWLLLHERTEAWGIGVLVLVASTDWVDGYIARRTGAVTELGKILDPVADRLALAAARVSFVIRVAFPLWAALLVILRDAAILLAGAVLLAKAGRAVVVRVVGKAATFLLMVGIPAIAWGNFGLWLGPAAKVAGWSAFAIGCTLYYVAAALYVGDLRAAFRAGRSTSGLTSTPEFRA